MITAEKLFCSDLAVQLRPFSGSSRVIFAIYDRFRKIQKAFIGEIPVPDIGSIGTPL